jgi:hypothetical protein
VARLVNKYPPHSTYTTINAAQTNKQTTTTYRDHEASFSMGVHSTDEILSWHRVFILRLENILRQVFFRVCKRM